jgi:glyoxylase-like metal-dependent hydrolase (beta-lactamase superfamily II)
MKYTTKGGWEVIPLIGFFIHAFLVRKNDVNLLVDTGRKSMRKRLLRQLQKQGVENLRYLMITHAHFDHAENAACIKEQFGAVILTNALEAPFLSEGKSNAIYGTRGFMGWLTRRFHSRIDRMYHYEELVPDITFSEEYIIEGSEGALKCLPVPGHTAGSSALIVDNEIALTGDAFAHHIPGSIFPPFGEDPRKIVESWKVLLDTGCVLFFPAHGNGVSRNRLQKEFEKNKQKFF